MANTRRSHADHMPVFVWADHKSALAVQMMVVSHPI